MENEIHIRNKDNIELKFKIIKVIYSSGEAYVYLVENKSDNMNYAARTLDINHDNFKNEVKYLETLANGDCPYIVK